MELHHDHPDAETKVGDTREAGGQTWKFGANQFTKFWRAGPKNGTIVCSRDYPYGITLPYFGDGIACSTFEAAATRAMAGAKREYERALDIVRKYEADK